MPRPPAPTLTVAFLGLGAMGVPMATRLVQQGFDVRAWNRTPKIVRGLTMSAAAAECVRGADVVVTMLSDADAVHAVLDGGVLAALKDQKKPARPVFLEMSTIGRKEAVAIAKKIEDLSGGRARFVDAPVSGTVAPAAKGELVALVGGDVRSVERARPVLEAMCKKVIHAGGVGQGQALKVMLNGVGAHHFVALTSMLALGERAGLARDVMLDAVTSGAFATPSYIGKRSKLLTKDFTPEFSLALALKDVALNVSLQHECKMKLPVVRAIVAELERGVAEGLGDLDLFALEKAYGSQDSRRGATTTAGDAPKTTASSKSSSSTRASDG